MSLTPQTAEHVSPAMPVGPSVATMETATAHVGIDQARGIDARDEGTMESLSCSPYLALAGHASAGTPAASLIGT